MEIALIKELPENFDHLRNEASQAGHEFLAKMKTEWDSGKNRFEGHGEALFSVSNERGEVVGVGGLNIDPYLNDSATGRVRHIYVSARFQGSGYGKALVQKIIEHARKRFKILRLRTHNPLAVNLYRSFGFEIDSRLSDEIHTCMQLRLN